MTYFLRILLAPFEAPIITDTPVYSRILAQIMPRFIGLPSTVWAPTAAVQSFGALLSPRFSERTVARRC